MVDVAEAVKRLATYAFVVVELVTVAFKNEVVVAKKLSKDTLPENVTGLVNIELPLNTAFVMVGLTRERFVALPELIIGESMTVSLR